MEVTRARPGEEAELTNIALAAKQHWGYPKKWIASWRDALTIRPEFITSHETYRAVLGGRIVGFYAFAWKDGRAELVHLWVLPDVMGQGVGRSLFEHCIGRLRELGFRELEIESDPNAEEFYRHMGAQRVGVNVTDLDGQRRELPVLIYEIQPGDLLRASSGRQSAAVSGG